MRRVIDMKYGEQVYYLIDVFSLFHIAWRWCDRQWTLTNHWLWWRIDWWQQNILNVQWPRLRWCTVDIPHASWHSGVIRGWRLKKTEIIWFVVQFLKVFFLFFIWAGSVSVNGAQPPGAFRTMASRVCFVESNVCRLFLARDGCDDICVITTVSGVSVVYSCEVVFDRSFKYWLIFWSVLTHQVQSQRSTEKLPWCVAAAAVLATVLRQTWLL